MKKAAYWLHEALGYLLRGVLRVLVVLAFRPKRCYVSEKARTEAFREPMVIISNHVRGMDGGVMQTLMPLDRRVYSLSAKDLMDKSPALRLFLSFCRTIPVDREHPSLSWLRESRRLLRDGCHIYLCPEGYCHRDKVVRPFKPGFVTLAASSGVKVLPIYHNGEYHYFFGPRFRMMIGEPITLVPPPEGLSEEVMQRECREVLQVMNDLERRLNGFVKTLPAAGETGFQD